MTSQHCWNNPRRAQPQAAAQAENAPSGEKNPVNPPSLVAAEALTPQLWQKGRIMRYRSRLGLFRTLILTCAVISLPSATAQECTAGPVPSGYRSSNANAATATTVLGLGAVTCAGGYRTVGAASVTCSAPTVTPNDTTLCTRTTSPDFGVSVGSCAAVGATATCAYAPGVGADSTGGGGAADSWTTEDSCTSTTVETFLYAACAECAAGSHAAAGATSCSLCIAGTADEDGLPATACTACTVGKYSAESSESCTDCAAGTIDEDSNAASACTPCAIGKFSSSARSGTDACVACAAGEADADMDSATACIACVAGQHSAEGSTSCTDCAPGTADLDSSAVTTCTNCVAGNFAGGAGTTCTICESGRADLDSDSGTPCELCGAGVYTDTSSTTCTECAVGTYDDDTNPATACTACANGKYSAGGSTLCTSCYAGQSDHDSDPSTVCEACVAGQSALADAVACFDCAPGHVSTTGGACVRCEAGSEPNAAVSECVSCAALSADAWSRCEPGGTFSSDGVQCIASIAGHRPIQGMGGSEFCLTDGDDAVSMAGVRGSVHVYIDPSGVASRLDCDSGEEPLPDATGCQSCEEFVLFPDGTQGLVDIGQSGARPYISRAGQACVVCPVGKMPNTDRSECDDCGIGEASDGSECLLCAAGTQPNVEKSACEQCLVVGSNMHSTDGVECTACDAGEQPLLDRTGCESCAVEGMGFFSPRGDQCGACPVAKQPAAALDECRDCAPGESTPNGTCVCAPGYYNASKGGTLQCFDSNVSNYVDEYVAEYLAEHVERFDHHCKPCPTEGCVHCGVGGHVTISPGFSVGLAWAQKNMLLNEIIQDEPDKHIAIFRCPPGAICCGEGQRRQTVGQCTAVANSTNSTGNVCAPGYTGVLCSQCETRHTRGISLRGECRKCETDWDDKTFRIAHYPGFYFLACMFGIIAPNIVLSVFLWWITREGNDISCGHKPMTYERWKNWAKGVWFVASATLIVLMEMYANNDKRQAMRIFLGMFVPSAYCVIAIELTPICVHGQKKTPGLQDSCKECAARPTNSRDKVKITLTFVQVLSEFQGTFMIVFPVTFTWLIDIFGFLKLDVLQLVMSFLGWGLPNYCLNDYTFFEKWAAAVSSILLQLLFAWLVYRVKTRAWLVKNELKHGEKRIVKNAAIRVFFCALFVFFPTVSRTLLDGLICRELGPGESYLRVDMQVSCETGLYPDWETPFKLVAILFVVGVPVGIGVVLYLARRKAIAKQFDHRLGILGAIFDKLDTNHDGQLDQKELQHLLRHANAASHRQALRCKDCQHEDGPAAFLRSNLQGGAFSSRHVKSSSNDTDDTDEGSAGGQKMRALHNISPEDPEDPGAERPELTFIAGDTIMVTDSSDPERYIGRVSFEAKPDGPNELMDDRNRNRFKRAWEEFRGGDIKIDRHDFNCWIPVLREIRMERFKERYSFAVTDYSDSYYWWDSVEMLRKVWLTGLLAIGNSGVWGQPGSMFQLVNGICTSLVFLVVVARLKPYKKDESNTLKVGCDASTVLVLVFVVMLHLPADVLALERIGVEKLGKYLVVFTASPFVFVYVVEYIYKQSITNRYRLLDRLELQWQGVQSATYLLKGNAEQKGSPCKEEWWRHPTLVFVEHGLAAWTTMHPDERKDVVMEAAGGRRVRASSPISSPPSSAASYPDRLIPAPPSTPSSPPSPRRRTADMSQLRPAESTEEQNIRVLSSARRASDQLQARLLSVCVVLVICLIWTIVASCKRPETVLAESLVSCESADCHDERLACVAEVHSNSD